MSKLHFIENHTLLTEIFRATADTTDGMLFERCTRKRRDMAMV